MSYGRHCLIIILSALLWISPALANKKSKRKLPSNPYPLGKLSMELTSIDEALSKFHNQFCRDGARSRKGLLENWENFIKALPDPGSKQLAARAMAVDIVSRTALFEANVPGTKKLTNLHPHQIDCEQDLIALSLRNRISTCKKKSYGCNFEKDLAGAATTPTMYNIWAERELKKKDITRCFLKDTLQTNGKDKAFNLYRDHFRALTARTQKILGYDQSDDVRNSGSYLTQLFEAEALNGEALPADQKEHYLKEMLHYYHRGGLGVCTANKRTLSEPVFVTITEDMPGGKVRVPYDGAVVLKGGIRDSNEPVFKLVGENGPSKYDFYLSAQDRDKLQNDGHKAGFDCLPEGYPPECSHVFQDNSYWEQQGRFVPRWAHKEADQQLVKDMNLTRTPTQNAYGKYLNVRCKNPEYEEGGKWPVFGGKCSDKMRMFSEVDREKPPVADESIPVDQ